MFLKRIIKNKKGDETIALLEKFQMKFLNYAFAAYD